jgi:hypothetical protein
MNANKDSPCFDWASVGDLFGTGSYQPVRDRLSVYGFERFAGVTPVDVVVQEGDELLHDMIAAERAFQFAVDVDGGDGLLEGAGQRDADVRMLGSRRDR